jgi:hypothetical protein
MSSVMWRSTVTTPPRLLTLAGNTDVDTRTGSWVSCEGTTEFEVADGFDDPIVLDAVTVNAYEAPFVRPVT